MGKSAVEIGERQWLGRKVGVRAAKAYVADDPTTADECETDYTRNLAPTEKPLTHTRRIAGGLIHDL